MLNICIDDHDEEENDDYDDDDDDKYDNVTMMITMLEECLCEGRHLAVFGRAEEVDHLGLPSHHTKDQTHTHTHQTHHTKDQTHNLNMAQGRSNMQNYQTFIIKFH